MTRPSRPQLALAQCVAADVLAAIKRPIVVNGFAYTRFACCEAPKHALAWAVAEAGVAATVWAALAEHGAVRPCEATLARRFACPVCFRGWWQDQRHGRYERRGAHGESCPVCHGAGVLEAPPTCVACVTLAADPDGICAAEARVVDLARALAPWGAREPERRIAPALAPAPGRADVEEGAPSASPRARGSDRTRPDRRRPGPEAART